MSAWRRKSFRSTRPVDQQAGTWSATVGPRPGCGKPPPSPRACSARSDHRRREGVVAGLFRSSTGSITAGMTSGKERREQLLQEVPQEEILLTRLADHGGGQDRVATAQHPVCGSGKTGSRASERVVPVVVTEGSLGSTLAAGELAHQAELGLATSTRQWSERGCALSGIFSPLQQEAREQELGTFSGSGAMAERMSAGRAAEEHVDRQRLIEAALPRPDGSRRRAGSAMCIPVDLIVVELHAVHAEIRRARLGMLGQDQGQA